MTNDGKQTESTIREGPLNLDLADASSRTPRNRRRASRVQLADPGSAALETPIRIRDISATGVGFLVPREDAALIDQALVLVHVNEGVLLRARVQRVDLGSRTKHWVSVGARFVDLGDEDRASLHVLLS